MRSVPTFTILVISAALLADDKTIDPFEICREKVVDHFALRNNEAFRKGSPMFIHRLQKFLLLDYEVAELRTEGDEFSSATELSVFTRSGKRIASGTLWESSLPGESANAMLRQHFTTSMPQDFMFARLGASTNFVGEFCIAGIGSGRTELVEADVFGSDSILFARNGKALTLWGTPGNAAGSGELGLYGVAVALDMLLHEARGLPPGSGMEDAAMRVNTKVKSVAELRGGVLDSGGIVTKTNMVDFLSYRGAVGLKAIEDTHVPNAHSLVDVGLENMAWVMWQKDIVFSSNDVEHAEWRCPTNVAVDSFSIDVDESDVLHFAIRKAGVEIANGEAKVFNTCKEQLISFMLPYARRFASSSAPLQLDLLVDLDVAYLGTETNMLYITERGSREDSLTYKNIALNIRYTDDSLAKHRKAIAVALMNAGAVLKPRNPQAPASGRASDKEAVEGEKKKDLKENAETRTVK